MGDRMGHVLALRRAAKRCGVPADTWRPVGRQSQWRAVQALAETAAASAGGDDEKAAAATAFDAYKSTFPVFPPGGRWGGEAAAGEDSSESSGEESAGAAEEDGDPASQGNPEGAAVTGARAEAPRTELTPRNGRGARKGAEPRGPS